MRLPDYHWLVMRTLPSQYLAPMKRALRHHSHRHRSEGFSRRAATSLDAFSAALDEYEARHVVYRDSIDASLEARGVSGAHADPETNWDAMGDGARGSLVKAMDKRDARDHALDLGRRIVKAMREGRDDTCGI